MQDAAYGTLLRDARRTLHARIAETLECHFTEIAENQPELLARHYSEAGQIEKAASLWGKAGERSLQRSALVEAMERWTQSGLGIVGGKPPGCEIFGVPPDRPISNSIYSSAVAGRDRIQFDQLNERDLMALLGGAVAAWPLAARRAPAGLCV